MRRGREQGSSSSGVGLRRAPAADKGSSESEQDDEDADEESGKSHLLEAGARVVAGDSPHTLRERELDRQVWHEYSSVENPNIFGNLFIAEDSGFSEVDELWYKSRWITALLTISFILSNVYFIISTDFNILAGKPASGDLDDSTRTMYLVTSPISKSVFNTGSHSDDMIATFELGGLTVLLSSAVHQCCVFLASKCERKKWFALERLFWQIVPQLSSYSSMRLLHNVSPTVFLSTVSTHISETSVMDSHEAVKAWVKLVVFHLFCLIVGFDSFLVKIRAAYSSINEKTLTLSNLYGAAVFMVQVLGIVRLGTFVQQRLFVFIFAGEDSVMQPHEKAKQHVWNALLVRKIHQTFPLPKFFAIMLSFDDTDFQKLVLNERLRGGPSAEKHPAASRKKGDVDNDGEGSNWC